MKHLRLPGWLVRNCGGMPLLLRAKRWRQWHAGVQEKLGDWRKEFPWLVVSSYGLGCSICCSASVDSPWARHTAASRDF